jgi:acetyl-CoA carboxylase carboxyltransferase component
MNSKSLGADLEFAWEDASIGMMDSRQAAEIIYGDEVGAASDPKALIGEKAAELDRLQASAEAAAGRGIVDAIISPAQTRKHLIAAFQMLDSKDETVPYRKHQDK